jgi:hypothetical protein
MGLARFPPEREGWYESTQRQPSALSIQQSAKPYYRRDAEIAEKGLGIETKKAAFLGVLGVSAVKS